MTLGLKDLYYAVITEAPETGAETYGTPVKFADAISANLGVEYSEGTLYADDKIYYEAKEFRRGTLSLNTADLSPTAAAALLGAKIDDNGVLVDSGDDTAKYVAIGFRARKAGGKYKYVWLYKVKFAVPSSAYTTKGESFTFNTPTIEGVILQRKKADYTGGYPWRAQADEDSAGIDADTITGWFTQVYEPSAGSEG